MGGMSTKVVCAYCGVTIIEGLPPVSHGCCDDCFNVRIWDEGGPFMLTEEEIGKEQFEKAKIDRARFRGVPGEALAAARERGGECIRLIQETQLKDADTGHWAPYVREAMWTRMERDAVSLAVRAFRAWRAYRIMRG